MPVVGVDMTTDKAAAALEYRERGLSVIPLCWPTETGECACGRSHKDNSVGKAPLIEWLKYRDDPAPTSRIEKWWARWSQANLGLVTGAFIVVDVDVADPAKALDAFEQLAGSVPPTATVFTGRGVHLYFEHPGRPVSNKVQLNGSRIDVRGSGGYVVAPPSVHASGATYRWDDEHGLGLEAGFAPLPTRLLKLLEEPAEPSGTRKLVTIDRIIPAGERNDVLTRICGKLVADGLRSELGHDVLRAINDARCQPPLPEDEVRRIVRSVLKREARKESAVEEDRIQWSPVLVGDLVTQRPELLRPPKRVAVLQYLGCTTLVSGLPKESGKSTLLRHMAKAVASGTDFLGEEVDGGPVLWLALEEPLGHLVSELERIGATRLPIIVDHPSLWSGGSRPDFEAVAQFIADAGVRLMVIDTLSDFWSVENEDDARQVYDGFQPIKELSRETGVSVSAIHHLRKSEGSGGRRHRGSGALVASVDVAIELQRKDDGRPNQRELRILSRLPGVPDGLVVELTDSGYRSLGAPDEASTSNRREKLLNLLRVSGPLDIVPLKEAMDVGRSTLQEDLDALAKAGNVLVTGQGVKGSPFVYSFLPSKEKGPAERIKNSDVEEGS